MAHVLVEVDSVAVVEDLAAVVLVSAFEVVPFEIVAVVVVAVAMAHVHRDKTVMKLFLVHWLVVSREMVVQYVLG